MTIVSLPAFFWLLHAGSSEQYRLGQAVLMALFFSLGLTGPVLVDDWLLAVVVSIALSAVLGFFAVGLALTAGGL